MRDLIWADSRAFWIIATNRGDRFTADQAGGTAEVELVQEDWTNICRRIPGRIMGLPWQPRTAARMLAAYEDSDFEKME